MVKDCPNCSEHSFATRYKDSYLSFCRECGYYEEAVYDEDNNMVEESGFLDNDEFESLKRRFPINE
jgi:DNA-directed RNA polymerase subunit M/transcription elongation factor TFIIS